MPERSPAHIFLVGFPRSGTTLLQSLLAAHPDVLSLPETFFFVDAVASGRRWRLPRRAHPRARGALDRLGKQGVEVVEPGVRDILPIATIGPTVRRFVDSLDASARRSGKRAWVEKTPSHLHYLATIERYVPAAQVVHIVREGVPAIASLRAVTEEHAGSWGGGRSLEDCTARWREDVRRSHACRDRPNHSFVAYEGLVADPSAVLGALTRRLGLRSDPATIREMVEGYGSAAAGLVVDEPWKASVGTPIANRNGDRVARMFSAEERRAIERAIAPEQRLLAELPFA